MVKELSEDELNIRRKARRRLVGAVALTLAVVVILPMVLDSEPKPGRQDIDLRIPDSGKAGEFVPGVAIPEESDLPPLANSGVVAAAPEAEKSSATAARLAVVENPSKEKTASKASETRRAEPSTNKAADKGFVVQIGAYSNADTAKQELGKLKKWGFKAYTEKLDGKIRVRVGPYEEREKAEKVGDMLEKHGLKPVILSGE